MLGDVESFFDLEETYFISGKGMNINGTACSGSISFYYNSDILAMVQWNGYITSTNIDKTPSFNGIRYTDPFSTVAERFGANTLVGNYAHYCFADKAENGTIELIPPSLNKTQIKEAEHPSEVYSFEDLRAYKTV